MIIDLPDWPKAVKRILRHDVKKMIETANEELPQLLKYQSSLIELADSVLEGIGIRLVKSAGASNILIWRERSGNRARYTKIDKNIIDRFVPDDVKKVFARIERERIITNFIIKQCSFNTSQGADYISDLRYQERITQP